MRGGRDVLPLLLLLLIDVCVHSVVCCAFRVESEGII